MNRATCVLLVLTSSASAEPLTARVGVDVGTDIFRNIPEAQREMAIAPIVELAVPIVEREEGAITKVELGLAGWVSMHSEPLGQPADLMGTGAWDEADGAARATVTVANTIAIGGAYTAYTSPNGTAKHIHEASLGVAWNDPHVGRWHGCSPSLLVAQELSGTRAGMSRGTFLGLQARPAFEIASAKQATVEVALPVELDLSMDDYYDDAAGDDTVGAMSAGLSLATTVPAHFGTWSFSATTRAIHFGPRMAARAGDSTVVTMTGTVAVNF